MILTCLVTNKVLLTKNTKNYDVTVVGSIVYTDGLGRLPIIFIDMLKDSLKINCITTFYDFNQVPVIVKKVVSNPDKKPGKVSIFFDVLSNACSTPADKVPNNSKIKIAYSMFESTAIPEKWVEILNTKFDAVVVPDIFLVQVYKNSGVKIPVFVLPAPLYLQDFLNKKLEKRTSDNFTFGVSSGFFTIRKNFDRVIKAFTKEFANNSKVKLKIHCQPTDIKEQVEFTTKVKKLIESGYNIELINKILSKAEYIDFLSSLNCFISVSRAEGFSNIPREALALGVPCILSNNTGQKTICNTGLVRFIQTPILKEAYYSQFKSTCGYNFDFKTAELKKAMRDVYSNYNFYASKARQAKLWVKQYLPKNLKKYYLTLIKPRCVMLSQENKILDGVILTNSKALIKKYLSK